MYTTLKQRAKFSVKSKRGACTAFAFICLIFLPFIEFSAYNLSILFRRYSHIIMLMEYITTLVFMSALSLGCAIFFLKLSKREDAEFINFFDGFENIFKAIVLVFVMGLFVFLWSLLLIVPGIMALYSYRVSIYILAECPELSPLDALRISKNMMKGRRLRLFMLDLSFIGWFILSVATFGIVGLYFIPYYEATNTEFYRELKADYIERQKNTSYTEDSIKKDKTAYRSAEERLNHTWEKE